MWWRGCIRISIHRHRILVCQVNSSLGFEKSSVSEKLKAFTNCSPPQAHVTGKPNILVLTITMDLFHSSLQAVLHIATTLKLKQIQSWLVLLLTPFCSVGEKSLLSQRLSLIFHTAHSDELVSGNYLCKQWILSITCIISCINTDTLFPILKNRFTSIHKGCKYFRGPGPNFKLVAIGLMFYENNSSNFSIIYNSLWASLDLPVL